MATPVAGIYGVVAVDLQKALGGLREFRSRLLSASINLKTLRDQAKVTGAAMSAALTVPALIAAKSAIDMVGDYEKAMSIFQTITKATGADMDEAAALAVKLGNDISLPGISAGNAADALSQLAKGGLSARNAMDALRGTLQLASAGELDAATAAGFITDALNAFKLPGTEATKVADLLAAAAMSAGSSITENAQAMQQAGTVWALAGIPLNELVTSIALMAQAGVKGSDAGTSLKTMMTALIAPTEQGAAMMRAMGINVYDAQNNMKPFPQIIAEFQRGLAPLTEAQRNQRLETIFGSDAIRAASVVLGGGAGAFATMAEKVGEAGAAEKLAAASSTGLGGALEGLRSSWETLLLKAVLQFSPAMQFVINLLSGLMGWVSDLHPAILRFGVAFVGTLAVLGPIALALSSISVAGAIAAGIALLIAGAWATAAGILAGASAFAWPLLDAFKSLQSAANENLIPAMNSLGDVADLVFKGKFKEAFAMLNLIYEQSIQPFLSILSRTTRDIGDKVGGWANEMLIWIKPLVAKLIPALQPFLDMFLGWVQSNYSFFYDLGQLIMHPTWDGFVNFLDTYIRPALPGQLGKIYDDVHKWADDNQANFAAIGQLIMAPSWASLRKFIDTVIVPGLPTPLRNIYNAVSTWVDNNHDLFAGTGETLANAFMDGFKNALLNIRIPVPSFNGLSLTGVAWKTLGEIMGGGSKSPPGGNGGQFGAGVSGYSGGGGTFSGPGGLTGIIPALAAGGIVTRPTIAMIGERGPEAVVPLGSGGAGGTTNVYITGPVYGVDNLQDLVVQAVTKAQQRGRLSPAF